MNLLEKLERRWKMHETLHQLKDTLMRYGMDLTTPLSRIDKDYVPGQWNTAGDGSALVNYKYSCYRLEGVWKNEYRNFRNQKAWLRLTTQAKDIRISDNFFAETVNRDNDSIKTINKQECDFINFCGTCLLDAGYVSLNEKRTELKGDWTLQEITQHRARELNYIWTNAAFNNEVNGQRAWKIDNKFLYPTVLVRDACECYYYRRDRLYTLKVAGNLILNESFTPKMLLKGIHGKKTRHPNLM